MGFNYENRLEKLQSIMKREGLDAFVVSTQDGIYYLSGASYRPEERPFFIIVRQEGKYDLVVPYLEYEHMKKATGYNVIEHYFEYPSIKGQNWYELLSAMLGADARVGVEPDLAVAKSRLIQVREVVVSDAIARIRMVKEPEELEAIRAAAVWTDKGMKLLHGGIYPGCSVIETVTHARKLQTGLIATGEYDYLNCSFLTVGWTAPASAQPHGVPGFRLRMGRGPLVLMSYNRINGYAAECERTVFIGEPSKEELDLYHTVIQARELAFSMVRPGVACGEIDAATWDFFTDRGYQGNILHRVGHGIGMGNHEQPWLSRGSEDILEKNMVISVEPGLYFDDIGGFRHSDTVLVTEDGYELLTHYPRDLESLIIRSPRFFKRIQGAIVRKAINV
ncbi:MAG: Xaa-Pro peptidase family protein [Coriobacteriia bacterium]|nr:Xaa-Pro peptidase family protein [Coriobacteriia bacterium]